MSVTSSDLKAAIKFTHLRHATTLPGASESFRVWHILATSSLQAVAAGRQEEGSFSANVWKNSWVRTVNMH